jgi:LmbE family N-acetylglucosaminyl deacetylase
MQMLNQPNALLYIPSGEDPAAALGRVTHMAIGAHPDDIEIMAVDGILRCYDDPAEAFCGVVVTDGAGSPRSGSYAGTSSAEMVALRVEEQKEAARLGRYAAQALLGYPSAAVRNGQNAGLTADLEALLRAARPKVVYTHNPADRHPTHVAVCLRVIEALRALPPDLRPQFVFGCEVWGSLDWVEEHERVAFDVSAHPQLQAELVRVFRSQIEGGKAYEQAAIARRVANATFRDSHTVDQAERLIFALDLTPLLESILSVEDFVTEKIHHFEQRVSGWLRKI